MKEKRFIIFDGSCGFCHKSIRFIANRDTQKSFLFISNQSEMGKQILCEYGVAKLSNDTVLLIQDKKVYARGVAFIKILKQLPGWKTVEKWFSFIPIAMVNWGYDVIAKNRKRLFSQQNCKIPTHYDKSQFIF